MTCTVYMNVRALYLLCMLIDDWRQVCIHVHDDSYMYMYMYTRNVSLLH